MEVKRTSTKPVTSITRRRFLALVTHGGWLAAMGILVYQIGRFMGGHGLETGPSPVVAAGSLEDYPPETTTYVPQARAWVHNDGGELAALDAVCPHLGCLVRQKEADGSEFGPDGELERGPAERTLRPLDIQTTDDNTVIIRS